MLSAVRERFTHRPAQTPVSEMLDRVRSLGYDVDDYTWRLRSYLGWAASCGLESEAVVYSCVDLAETLSPDPIPTERRRLKLAAWEEKRRVALAVVRGARVLELELDPVYFEAILGGSKTIEGRANNPAYKDRNYPDMRRGDYLYFSLSRRQEGLIDDAARRGLLPDDTMVCTLDDVLFAPTVHGIYQQALDLSYRFQPMIEGDCEIIRLQSAAVYHAFPGYHEAIKHHGFIGFALSSPRLIHRS